MTTFIPAPKVVFSDRIIDTAEYGRHIGLTCKNHPDLRWNTKNISPIGCRSIFFNGHKDELPAFECSCPLSDLVPLEN